MNNSKTHLMPKKNVPSKIADFMKHSVHIFQVKLTQQESNLLASL